MDLRKILLFGSIYKQRNRGITRWRKGERIFIMKKWYKIQSNWSDKKKLSFILYAYKYSYTSENESFIEVEENWK